MKSYRFIVTGKVQGVFYRKSIKEVVSLGQIQGHIRNLADGSVEVVAYLWDEQLKDFLQILKNGSPMSKVDNVTYEEIDLNKDEIIYDGFEIRS